MARSSRLVLGAATLLAPVAAQSTLPVWAPIVPGPPLTPAQQERMDVSKAVLSIGSALQIIINGSCLVRYGDRPDRPWHVQRFGTPYFPCAAAIGDPHVAYYESGSFGNPRWFVSGFTIHNTSNPALDAACVNGTLQSYEINGATCGDGSWLQHAYNEPFATYGQRAGYFTRFAQATGPVVLGGFNSSTGEALTDVWANCRSFFDCPQLGCVAPC